jgi:hypothetical protein
MLRGMSTLNLENLTIQQSSNQGDRELTQTSKHLLYSPEKPIELSPHKFN